MKLTTTYIYAKDIQKSLDFYKKLLQKEPLYSNEDRWITFDCGNFISLYNKKYDEILINEASCCFNQAYIDEFFRDKTEKKNNIVVFNFEANDLKKEYDRLKKLNIGKVSEMMYVNVHMPYWYFNVEDPDGNILEITGKYDVDTENT